MKHLNFYITETSDKLESEDELLKLLNVKKENNSITGYDDLGEFLLYEKDLEFHNGKKWIYGYKLYWRGKYDTYNYPFIGVVQFNRKPFNQKAFIINNKSDLKRFAKACVNEDNSLFELPVEKEIIATTVNDYYKAHQKMALKAKDDKTIIWAQIAYDGKSYEVWRYKQ